MRLPHGFRSNKVDTRSQVAHYSPVHEVSRQPDEGWIGTVRIGPLLRKQPDQKTARYLTGAILCGALVGICMAGASFFPMHRILTETIISPMPDEDDGTTATFFDADALGRIYLGTAQTADDPEADSADGSMFPPQGTAPIQSALATPDMDGSLSAETEPTPKILRKPVIVKKGDTLGKILSVGSVASSEIHAVTTALRTHFKPTNLRPGQQITLIYAGLPDNQHFAGLELEPTPGTILTVSRTETGTFTSSSATAELERRLTAARATINSSLFEAGAKAGIPASVMASMIRIFSWDIDFQRDVHAGDEFAVLYDSYYTPSGKQVQSGNVLYASLKVGNKARAVYRFEDSDGIADYYGVDGKSIRKALLKTPVDGARISSGYGLRKHPILGYSKMHKGVDFAAPRGSPIFAAGDGSIERLGPWSTYGNYVRIRHNNSISTAYAHIDHFAKGMKRGTRVSQGQVIGYVGTTGRSTGPHLHYEVIKAGKQVNPNSVDLPIGREISRKDKTHFSDLVAQIDSEFSDSLAQSTLVATAP